MIKLKTLKIYGFTVMEDYYQMIVESKINGNHDQAVEQTKALSILQKFEFLYYVNKNSHEYYDFFYVLCYKLLREKYR